MKTLGLALLLLSTQLMASEELSGSRCLDVREALIDSLIHSQLSCSFTGVPRPSNRMIKDVIIMILNNDSARYFTFEDDVRPKITVKRPTNYRDLNYVEMNFNTTFDLEKVEFIELYESRVRLERQNVGTIFNPRFEMVEVHDELLSGRCDLY